MISLRLFTSLLTISTLLLCGCSSSPTHGDNTQAQRRIIEQLDAYEKKHGEIKRAALADSDDLLKKLTSGFRLDHTPRHPRVLKETEWYLSNSDFVDRALHRSTPYLYHIVQEVSARGMPLEVALLPLIESAYNPNAYSRSHAVGLWQFIPSTGKYYGLKQDKWYDGRRDIEASTSAALDYLETLKERYNGDWLLALAAYNSGEGNVDKAIQRNQAAGEPTDFWSLSLPRETESYPPKLLAIAHLIEYHPAYAVTLPTIDVTPVFERIYAQGPLHFDTLASLMGLSLTELVALNPGFQKKILPKGGPHPLLVHKGIALVAQNRLNSYMVAKNKGKRKLEQVAKR